MASANWIERGPSHLCLSPGWEGAGLGCLGQEALSPSGLFPLSWGLGPEKLCNEGGTEGGTMSAGLEMPEHLTDQWSLIFFAMLI